MVDENPLDDHRELARPLEEVSAVVSRIKGNDLRFDFRGETINMVHLKMLASSEDPGEFFILGVDEGGDAYVLDLGERHGDEEWVRVTESSTSQAGVEPEVAQAS